MRTRLPRFAQTLLLGFGLLPAAWLPEELSADEAFSPPPNAEFRQGGDKPDGWTLSGGEGRWVDRDFLELTGNGRGANEWRAACRFVPGGLYRFAMRARQVEGGGCVTAGPPFANRDHRLQPASSDASGWKWSSFVFRVPDDVDESSVRVGQWEANGTVQFDAVRLTPVLPVHTQAGDAVLGEGESIRDGRYAFSGMFGGEGANYHRTLQSATATFNSNRWCFAPGGQVTYRFAVPGRPFRSGRATVNVNYYMRGACAVEVSFDGAAWQPLTTLDKTGSCEAELPSAGLPAETVCLRLRAEGPGALFQVDHVEFSGEIGGQLDLAGRTAFAEIVAPSRDLAVDRLAFEKGRGGLPGGLLLVARQSGSGDLGARLTGSLTGPSGAKVELPPQSAQLDAGRPAGLRMPIPSAGAGHSQIELRLAADGLEPLALKVGLDVPDFYRTDYGRRIAGAGGEQAAAVWWCDATHKIPRSRAAPEAESAAAELSAAGGDREAVQIVVRPTAELKGLAASAGPLVGPEGSRIAAENVQILRVYYHLVHSPTDAVGVRDFWPDALPPLDRPLDVPAGVNQPLWVLVYVPPDARAGDYRGEVTLAAEGFSARVPIRLHVWGFNLPARNHIETAFGLSPGSVYRYQQLKTEEDKRRVFDMYLQNFAEHRISPYDPTPLDPIRVRFRPEADPPRAELDFSAFDRAMTRVVDRYGLTSFMLHLQGMGGGTFHARYEPTIGDYDEDTPQYRAMFSSYLRQLESHLREKGWLGMAYTYWFDEPDPKDYEFVRRGMERIKRYAPGLRTMITEEPGPELAGPIDIWCPVSFNYRHEQTLPRRAAGDRFWWYVCTGPKAPYCTLFIDHPATELRVWLWQTFQRDIRGILIWSANYWTSDTAFPDRDRPQNPYEDPMGYVSGYGTASGAKLHWGNGDGRFVYPPLAAAVPGASGDAPVVAPPASSIRWEMLREGIEDYEYLWLLRDLLDRRRAELPADQVRRCEALLEVPAEISRDLTTFTTDPAPIYARRAAVAEAIERLSHRQPK